MELNEKKIELVGAYLQGRLEGDALSSFLEEVSQNSLLKEELRIQQAILDGFEHKNNQELRSRLKTISSETKDIKKDASIIRMPWMKIVSAIAAVTLLCFAAYFLFDKPSDTDSLYAQYFEPSELTITRSTDLDSDLATLKELYNTKKYDKAIPLFQKLIDNDLASSNLRLAYGNTLMKCKKLSLAREQFENIINAKDPLYSDQSRWYLALLELKEGNLKEAKENLESLVSDSNSDFYEEAKELIGALETI